MSDMPEVRSVLSQQHPRSAAHESAGEQWLPICLALTWTQETMGDPCPDAFEAGREWEPSCRTAEQIAAPWQVPSSKLYFGIELPDCEAGFWDHRREREHTRKQSQTITNIQENHEKTTNNIKIGEVSDFWMWTMWLVLVIRLMFFCFQAGCINNCSTNESCPHQSHPRRTERCSGKATQRMW